MNLRIRALIAGSLVAGAILCGPAWAGPETKGFFCSNCMDSESARQQALQYAAPLECNSQEVFLDPSTELVCSSKDRRVILGNHLTREVFAFIVSRADALPWDTSAEPVTLTQDEELAYLRVLDLRVDWERILAEGMTMQPEASIQNEGACPDGTALDFALKPGGIAELENLATVMISSNLDEYQNELPWYIPDFGVGVRHRGVDARLQWPGGSGDEGNDLYVFEWPPGQFGLRDLIVFDIELRGQTDDGQAILEMDFNQEASRAAGFQLDTLLSGDAVVQDECTLETLEELQQIDPTIEFRIGGPSGDSFDFSGVGSGGGGELCSKILCATVCVEGNCSCQFEVAILTSCGGL